VLSESECAKFRQRLLHIQRELHSQRETGEDAARVVELDQTRVGRLSRMDALQGQAMSQARGRRREYELQRIAAAPVSSGQGRVRRLRGLRRACCYTPSGNGPGGDTVYRLCHRKGASVTVPGSAGEGRLPPEAGYLAFTRDLPDCLR
jgi:hypothetical protein